MRTSSAIDSSITAPKMMLASSSASSWMSVAASFTSCRLRSGGPVMLMSTPRAPEIERSSRSGLEIAFCAASTARFSPCATAAPIIAMPISDMMVRTSAKSRLMRPCTVIRSEMPRTAWRSTSSAFLKVSRMEELRPATESRRWFGMAISVSTLAFSSFIPSSACFIRRLPSKVNGLVTTPTVSEPSSFETLAMMGAAPVPVPPLPGFGRAVIEEPPEPPHHPPPSHPDLPEHAVAAAPVTVLLEPVGDETDCRRIHGTRNGVTQATQMKRRPEPHRQPEDALGERRHVLEHRPATGQHDPGGERLVAAGALDLRPGEHQHLLGARLDHLGEGAAREVVRRAPPQARHLHP